MPRSSCHAPVAKIRLLLLLLLLLLLRLERNGAPTPMVRPGGEAGR